MWHSLGLWLSDAKNRLSGGAGTAEKQTKTCFWHPKAHTFIPQPRSALPSRCSGDTLGCIVTCFDRASREKSLMMQLCCCMSVCRQGSNVCAAKFSAVGTPGIGAIQAHSNATDLRGLSFKTTDSGGLKIWSFLNTLPNGNIAPQEASTFNFTRPNSFLRPLALFYQRDGAFSFYLQKH